MEENQNKITFFTRVKWAIFNLENYDFFAVESTKKAILYFITLMIFFALLTSIGITYKFANSDLSSLAATQEYITQDMIDKLQTTPQGQLYVSFYLVSTIYIFGVYTVMAIIDVVLLSLLGLLTSRIIRISLRYSPIFNISIYSLTLSIVLNCIYVFINSFTNFEIKYFQIMYNAIAYIYLVTAILMIRSEMIKQELELAKLAEEQKKVREEIDEQTEKPEEKQEKPEKEEKEKEKKNDQENGADGEVVTPIITHNGD
ncbi:MAG: DUF1189 family protein [Clostridia bacterium]|nr:DUF1189 family protein [Clostridia bacterium]